MNVEGSPFGEKLSFRSSTPLCGKAQQMCLLQERTGEEENSWIEPALLCAQRMPVCNVSSDKSDGWDCPGGAARSFGMEPERRTVPGWL
jgi:hypothetical protein